jgi:signal transduction histidine kinase
MLYRCCRPQFSTNAPGISPELLLMMHSESRARQDLAVVAGLTAGFALLSVALDLSERLLDWTRAREWLQLDELPHILLVLAGLLSWFAWRRMSELRAELARRRAAERQLDAAIAEVRRLGRQAVDVQESERRALAREMHDELGQYLVAIRMDATGIRDGADAAPGKAMEAAATIVRHVDHVQAVVRDIIGRLRPAGLDELGLAAALENCVEGWRRRLPAADIELSIQGDVDGLGEEAGLALYRLAQECLTNASRHAAASRIRLELAVQDEPDGRSRVTFGASDDGRGTTTPPATGGFGLAGMRERVRNLGGRFQAESSPGAGFRVQATIWCGRDRGAGAARADAA